MCHGQMIGDALHRARKQHQCDSCGRAIAPGREYERVRAVDGREAWTYKMCRTCAALAVELHPQDCPSEGLLSMLDGMSWAAMRRLIRKNWTAVRRALKKEADRA